MVYGLVQINRPGRRSKISLGNKINAIAAVALKGVDVKTAVEKAYAASDVDKVPSNASVVFTAWMRSIDQSLKNGDAQAIELCKAANIVRERDESEVEAEEEVAAPRKTRGRPKTK
jgi:hypothetical protein